PVLDDARSEVFGYVVREGVTNVVRHSGASACRIEVTDDRVTVTDDGRGFPTSQHRTGLRGLAHRVEAAGGVLEVDSGLDGTIVRAVFGEQEVTR
ncbi:MAG: sensor histidine kinase, partial [Propionibacterium sp.]|nr:sensor histidine kinase [Propionibacterium sp.]